MQFNVLVTTYEYIMRDRAKLSKVRCYRAQVMTLHGPWMSCRSASADTEASASHLTLQPLLSQCLLPCACQKEVTCTAPHRLMQLKRSAIMLIPSRGQ